MKVQIQAPFQVSEPMQDLINEKMEKVSQIFERITKATVYLKDEVNRNNHKDSRHVQIEVEVPGQRLFAEDEAETFEKAIASATDKMKRQVRDYKSQLLDHR